MSPNVLNSALDWLHAGYPDGVPPKDVLPLVALLERSLTPGEVQTICRQMISGNADGEIPFDDVVSAIAKVKSTPPSMADINDIAARLAAVGWPLSVPDDAAATTASDEPGRLQRALNWLRAGYPEGVPPTDYVPVLAVLETRLSEDDVKQVAREIIHAREDGELVSAEDIEALIQQVTSSRPNPHDVERVAARLARKGWPLQAVA